MFNSNVKIVNLTPHSLYLWKDEEHVAEIPSSGNVRVLTKSVQVGTFCFNGIEMPAYETKYGEVEGLPEPQEGVVYVVSMLVKMACEDRTDLYSPSQLKRDESGRIVGMYGLE